MVNIMKVSSKEFDLLEFAASSSMGVIQITDYQLDNIAYGLYRKGLFSRYEKIGPFQDGPNFWTITEIGRQYINNIQ